MDSDNMEARVVIFEDAKEVERVFNKLGITEYPDYDIISYTILTSAMKFDMKNADPTWIYLGTSKYSSNCDRIQCVLDLSDIM